jgi:hypothetical protein
MPGGSKYKQTYIHKYKHIHLTKQHIHTKTAQGTIQVRWRYHPSKVITYKNTEGTVTQNTHRATQNNTEYRGVREQKMFNTTGIVIIN